MSNKNINRKGYKPTKLGWIPDEWEVDIIKKIASKVTDGTHDTPKKVKSGSPFITAIHVKERHIDFESCYYLSQEDHEIVFRRCNPELEDVLIVNIGASTGTSAVVNVDYQFSLKNVALVKPKKEIIIGYFLNEFLISIKGNLLFKILVGGAQPFMSLDTIGKITVLLPPLPEQKKIAQILSSWDEAITTTEKLIEKLKTRKKGLMQQLLTGKTRLKGFSGEWESVKLRTVISRFIVPMRDKPKNLKGNIPWCRIEDFDGKYLVKSKTNQGVSIETIKNMNLKVYPINTLLVSCSANLGKCAIVKTELITNQTFIGLVPIENNIDVEFLYYLMIFLERELNRLSSGTTISYLSREEFEEFKIKIPESEEQKAIAQILTTADSEININEKYLFELQTQKKGLMQKLLTGEVRVKTDIKEIA